MVEEAGVIVEVKIDGSEVELAILNSGQQDCLQVVRFENVNVVESESHLYDYLSEIDFMNPEKIEFFDQQIDLEFKEVESRVGFRLDRYQSQLNILKNSRIYGEIMNVSSPVNEELFLDWLLQKKYSERFDHHDQLRGLKLRESTRRVIFSGVIDEMELETFIKNNIELFRKKVRSLILIHCCVFEGISRLVEDMECLRELAVRQSARFQFIKAQFQYHTINLLSFKSAALENLDLTGNNIQSLRLDTKRQRIRRLSLRACSFENFQKVLAELKTSESLEELDMSYSKSVDLHELMALNLAKVRYLALEKVALMAGSKLSSFSLRGWSSLEILNLKGFKQLKSLVWPENLRVLNLAETQFQDSMVENLFQSKSLTHLVELDLSQNQISEIDCEVRLKNLERLTLRDNLIVSKAQVLSLIGQLPRLRELDLSVNDLIEAEDSWQDGDLTSQLTALNLSDQIKIRFSESKLDLGYLVLPSFQNLTTLNLSENQLEDSFFQILRNSSCSLTSLSLSQNFLTEEGVLQYLQSIGGGSSLRRIDLSNNRIQKEMRISLLNSQLESLDLSYNQIEAIKLEVQHRSDFEPSFSLFLQGNRLSTVLISVAADIEQLNLSYNENMYELRVQGVVDLLVFHKGSSILGAVSYKNLVLSASNHPDIKQVSELGSEFTAQSISLSNVALLPSHLQISNYENLRVLRLVSCGLTEDSPILMGLLPRSLLVVDLSSNALEKFPESLRGLASLEELNLSRNKIQEISQLGCFKNLKKLNLGSNKLVKFENSEVLERLLELEIQGNSIEDEQFCSLIGSQNYPNLRYLNLQYNPINAELEWDSKLQNLQILLIGEGRAYLKKYKQITSQNNEFNKSIDQRISEFKQL